MKETKDYSKMTDIEAFNKANYGGYNDFPPNWSAVTEDEFWNRFCMRVWSRTETRQMIDKENNRMVQARLFFYYDTIGLAFVYQVNKARYITPLLYKFFLCDHKNKENIREKSSMCYHVSRCKDCGQEFHVDSSD